MAIVESLHSVYDRKMSRQTKNLLGIVTLEDIVEEILQAEIIDESDSVIDNTYRSRRKRVKDSCELLLFSNYHNLCKAPLILMKK